MRTSFGWRVTTVVVALHLSLMGLAAAAAMQEKKTNSAATPAPRDANWVKRHEGFVEIAKKGGVDVLFLGDSITDAWRGKNVAHIWGKHFEPLQAANFGIGGDRTQHVLWRLDHGELDGITPKVVVLMIGTNNSNGNDNTAAEIADGVRAIVQSIQEKSPKTKVLLLGVFPRADKFDRNAKPKSIPADGLRKKIDDINKIIAKLDNGKTIRYRDIGGKFLESDGSLSADIMPDFLHLSPKGYEIWAESIMPTLKEMLGE
jgi:lysophospholipase L1-like esterase